MADSHGTAAVRYTGRRPAAVPDHVVITGASSGIGAALARLYAAWGSHVSLIARNKSRLEAVAEAARARGAEVGLYAVDVTDSAALETALLACEARGPVSLLIANAGVGGREALASTQGETGPVARCIISTNVIGVVNTVTALLPRMVARRRGQIALMSSLAGLVALPACPAYCGSKAAIFVYGAALRRLAAPSRVGVSVICPGFVESPMSASLPFRPPFLWSADRAAAYIAWGLARGRREILFPWPLVAAVRLANLLPSALADGILRRAAGAEDLSD